MNKIKKIVVVGGGTSAWLSISSLLFKIHKSKNIEIICIESKDVPVIGVGESTTGIMWDVINFHDHFLTDHNYKIVHHHLLLLKMEWISSML